jgi:hypothetical protein
MGCGASRGLGGKNFRSCFHAHGNSGSATAIWLGKMTGSPFSFGAERFRVRAAPPPGTRYPAGTKNFVPGGGPAGWGSFFVLGDKDPRRSGHRLDRRDAITGRDKSAGTGLIRSRRADHRASDKISIAPEATSYIAPTIRIRPWATRALSVWLCWAIAATVWRTLARATLSTSEFCSGVGSWS